ncbi:MAG: DUF5786 family protein [Halobacteria archaeon]|nr:DUF5786 family protein [Halobacteria archaeon]
MGMGAYDEDEHEKREQQIGDVDEEEEEIEDDRKYYEGDVEYESEESVEDLVDKLEDIKSE